MPYGYLCPLGKNSDSPIDLVLGSFTRVDWGVILYIPSQSSPLTRLLYGLILAPSIFLMLGGHDTNAEEPLFNWLKLMMGWERCHFDNPGHFV